MVPVNQRFLVIKLGFIQLGILSGVVQPDRGTAFIDKYDIRHNLDAIYRIIGVCPQVNVFF